jgi:hypothetical protein
LKKPKKKEEPSPPQNEDPSPPRDETSSIKKKPVVNKRKSQLTDTNDEPSNDIVVNRILREDTNVVSRESSEY